jgi:hypothetical protein
MEQNVRRRKAANRMQKLGIQEVSSRSQEIDRMVESKKYGTKVLHTSYFVIHYFNVASSFSFKAT